jgi:hypothetical protein
MCNYMTGFSGQPCYESWCASFAVIPNPSPNTMALDTELRDEDDNRGSGR